MVAAELAQRLAQVLGLIVHDLMGAMGAREGELFVGGGAGDHARLHYAAELDGRETDPARSAQHGQCLARAQQRAMLERMIGGAVGDGQGGRAVEVEVGGDLGDLLGRDRGALARGVEVRIAEYPVAGLELGHARPDAFDHARELPARREREWRLGLVLAGDDQRIEEVQADGGDLGDHLAGTGHGIGNVGEHKVVGRAVALAENGFHGMGTRLFDCCCYSTGRRRGVAALWFEFAYH